MAVVLFVGSHIGPAVDPGAGPITIRQAEEDDLTALRSLEPDQATRIPALVKRGDGWLHVARDGDRLVGGLAPAAVLPSLHRLADDATRGAAAGGRGSVMTRVTPRRAR